MYASGALQDTHRWGAGVSSPARRRWEQRRPTERHEVEIGIVLEDLRREPVGVDRIESVATRDQRQLETGRADERREPGEGPCESTGTSPVFAMNHCSAAGSEKSDSRK